MQLKMIPALKPMIAPGSYFCTKCFQSSFKNIEHVGNLTRNRCLPEPANARCLPTKILYKHCLRFLFGQLQYSRNNGYAKFGGKQGALWSM